VPEPKNNRHEHVRDPEDSIRRQVRGDMPSSGQQPSKYR
jgi:hypothetical protein